MISIDISWRGGKICVDLDSADSRVDPIKISASGSAEKEVMNLVTTIIKEVYGE